MQLQRSRSSIQRSENLFGLAFCLPWFIGFLIFSAYPLFSSLYYSFTRYNITDAPMFVGMDNYLRLFRDKNLYNSLYNNLYFIIIGLPLCNAVALVCAFLLHSCDKLKGLFRTSYFLPIMMPVVASTVLWRFMYNPDYGITNVFLGIFGISGPVWLKDASVAKIALILMSTWTVGRSVVLYLTAMQNVSESYYEAAQIDGASPTQTFLRITMPLISPTLFFNLVVGLIGSFQYFTEPFLMTNGGPNGSTMTFTLYLYRNAFENLKMGYASAMGWLQLLIIFAYTIVMFRLQDKWVTYQ